jgi:hypothetical protein
LLWYVPEQILMRINNQSKRKRCKWSPKINFFLSWLDIPYSDHARYLYVEVRKKFRISYSLKTVYISSTKKNNKRKVWFHMEVFHTPYSARQHSINRLYFFSFVCILPYKINLYFNFFSSLSKIYADHAGCSCFLLT